MSFRYSSKLPQGPYTDHTTGNCYEDLVGSARGFLLGSTEAASFRTRQFVVYKAARGALHIESSDAAPRSFEEMYALRTDPVNRAETSGQLLKALGSSSGLALSNIGVSVALEIKTQQRRFATLVQSTLGSPYKLLSGYCDIGGAAGPSDCAEQELLATACRELTEELIVCRPSSPHITVIPMHVRTGATSDQAIPLRTTIPLHYSQTLTVETDHPPLEVTPSIRPAYLAGAFEQSQVIIDGHAVQASFYLDRRYRSGQIVFSFTLDLSDCAYTLFHAEDSYCSQSGLLESVLYPHGLILAELTPRGRLLGEFFWLREGELVPKLRSTKMKLSEVFTTCSGRPGIIERGAVSVSEYLLNQRGL